MLKQYLTLIDPLHNRNLGSNTSQLDTYPNDTSLYHQQIGNASFSNLVTPAQFSYMTWGKSLIRRFFDNLCDFFIFLRYGGLQ